jgi:hypothetical protein
MCGLFVGVPHNKAMNRSTFDLWLFSVVRFGGGVWFFRT